MFTRLPFSFLILNLVQAVFLTYGFSGTGYCQQSEDDLLMPPKFDQVSHNQGSDPISVVEAYEPIRVAENTGPTARRPRSNDDIPEVLKSQSKEGPVVSERRQRLENSVPLNTPATQRNQQPQVAPVQPTRSSFTPSANRPNLAQPGLADLSGYRAAAPIKPMSIQKSAPKIDTFVELPGYINLNQPAKMKIRLQNTGDANASSVKLLALIPEHVDFSKSNPEPSNIDGQVYEFQLFNFGANQIREVEIELVPTSKKPIDIGTEIVIENAQRFTVSVREPQIKLQLQGPTEVNLGTNITHKVFLENIGDGLAEQIQLTAIFPEELRSAKKNQLIIPSLEPGQKIEVEMPSQVMAAGQTELSVSVSAVGVETQTVSSGIKIYQPELEISAIGPQINFVNREGIYSLSLNNVGEIPSSNVVIELKVPAGLKVTTISQQAKIDPKTGVLIWNFDKIEPNSEQVLKFMTIATQQGSQDCQFTVRSKETREKTIFLTTNVVTRPELNITIQNQSGPIQVGGQAQFLVVVENTGSSKASDIAVQIELPDTLTADKQDGIDVLSLGNNISFEAAGLEPGQKREFRFTAIASEKGEHVVRSVLRTSASERAISSEGVVYVYEVNESKVREALAPAVVR